ncbi:hypothetical protein BHM03_00059951 [Ensete ventricosum]|nr:hypothetical protein BHM03_00059951 [Ensete ventricosum]
MSRLPLPSPSRTEATTCGSLLQELQVFPVPTKILCFFLPVLAPFLSIALLSRRFLGFFVCVHLWRFLLAVGESWHRGKVASFSAGASHRMAIMLIQDLWDEIGENDRERDRTILQLEQECLDLYRRKVDQTRKHKAELHQILAEGEAEVSNLISILGERETFVRVSYDIATFTVSLCSYSLLTYVLLFLLLVRENSRHT